MCRRRLNVALQADNPLSQAEMLQYIESIILDKGRAVQDASKGDSDLFKCHAYTKVTLKPPLPAPLASPCLSHQHVHSTVLWCCLFPEVPIYAKQVTGENSNVNVISPQRY